MIDYGYTKDNIIPAPDLQSVSYPLMDIQLVVNQIRNKEMQKVDCEYLDFKEFESTGKTSKFYILNKKSDKLGIVKWHAPWRRYCFFPYADTLWDNKCLDAVNSFIQVLMTDRKHKSK